MSTRAGTTTRALRVPSTSVWLRGEPKALSNPPGRRALRGPWLGPGPVPAHAAFSRKRLASLGRVWGGIPLPSWLGRRGSEFRVEYSAPICEWDGRYKSVFVHVFLRVTKSFFCDGNYCDMSQMHRPWMDRRVGCDSVIFYLPSTMHLLLDKPCHHLCLDASSCECVHYFGRDLARRLSA